MSIIRRGITPGGRPYIVDLTDGTKTTVVFSSNTSRYRLIKRPDGIKHKEFCKPGGNGFSSHQVGPLTVKLVTHGPRKKSNADRLGWVTKFATTRTAI